MITVIPDDQAVSDFLSKPFHQATRWREVMDHIADRLQWENIKHHNNIDFGSLSRNISMKVVTMDEFVANRNDIASIILLVGLDEMDANANNKLQEVYSNAKVKAIVPFNCSQSISQAFGRFGGEDTSDAAESFPLIGDWFRSITNARQSAAEKQRELTRSSVQDLWTRRSSDDLVFMILVLLDTFAEDVDIRSVKSVTATSNTGLKELSCMCKNCFQELLACFADEKCRKALDCLSNCKGNDQVCSYRCITSYESEKFERFAYCILQRNNCMGYAALSPSYPDPKPMTMFRGQVLTHAAAEEILFGHLKDADPAASSQMTLPWSWKVVCGQNPAYDYFSNQHQIFYRDRAKPSLIWYDPVFKVTTIDGEEVWRRRHYRVRRSNTKIPGQFQFSVIDNGVASIENWRILDCADDLSWAVFYYGGAAAAAGTSYTGALVVSPDGAWPKMTVETSQRIEDALSKGGIKTWELFEVRNEVDNVRAGPPPLGIIEGYESSDTRS
jgi:hypothetical protein